MGPNQPIIGFSEINQCDQEKIVGGLTPFLVDVGVKLASYVLELYALKIEALAPIWRAFFFRPGLIAR